MRVGIFGGTFDPPHRGHVEAAAQAAQELSLDRLFIIPTGIPPHKELPEGAPNAEERLAMTRIAFAEIPKAEVRDDELRRVGKSYTVMTLDALRSELPEAEFFLIMGADMFLSLETWREFERLITMCTVIALCRETEDDGSALERQAAHLSAKYGAKCRVLRHAVYEVSSSSVRAGVPAEDPRVPEAVRAYIRERGLYGRT